MFSLTPRHDIRSKAGLGATECGGSCQTRREQRPVLVEVICKPILSPEQSGPALSSEFEPVVASSSSIRGLRVACGGVESACPVVPVLIVAGGSRGRIGGHTSGSDQQKGEEWTVESIELLAGLSLHNSQ